MQLEDKKLSLEDHQKLFDMLPKTTSKVELNIDTENILDLDKLIEIVSKMPEAELKNNANLINELKGQFMDNFNSKDLTKKQLEFLDEDTASPIVDNLILNFIFEDAPAKFDKQTGKVYDHEGKEIEEDFLFDAYFALAKTFLSSDPVNGVTYQRLATKDPKVFYVIFSLPDIKNTIIAFKPGIEVIPVEIDTNELEESEIKKLEKLKDKNC